MKATMEALLSVDKEGWKKEITAVEESYAKFGSRLPFALKAKLAEISADLNK
jgi:GTP-dependent phosphoenolpyruvate carboxykinase